MLSSLKDKLLNVKISVPLFTNNKDQLPQEQVNLGAGSDILFHYQRQWATIHATCEDNAKSAEDVSSKIAFLEEQVERDKKCLGIVNSVLTDPKFQLSISKCTTQLNELYESFQKAETDLIHLENLIEETEFEKMKQQHRYHLQRYKERKQESLKSVEESLKDKYERSLVDAEHKKEEKLKERQQVFQEAFKSDLEVFKSLGTIPRLNLQHTQSGALLEEIQVDYDEKELDQFFEDNAQQ